MLPFIEGQQKLNLALVYKAQCIGGNVTESHMNIVDSLFKVKAYLVHVYKDN